MLLEAGPTKVYNIRYEAIVLRFSDMKDVSSSIVRKKMKQISNVGDVYEYKYVGWRRHLQPSKYADKWQTGIIVFTLMFAHKKQIKVSIMNQETILDNGYFWECGHPKIWLSLIFGSTDL